MNKKCLNFLKSICKRPKFRIPRLSGLGALILTLVLLASCKTYPAKYSLELSPQLEVFNKRGLKNQINLKDFIQPEKTKTVLADIRRQKPADFSLLKNLVAYVKSLPYKKEKIDYWNYTEETIQNGGDCEDKAHLLASLLMQAGFGNVYAVKGEIKKSFLNQTKGHVWVEITFNKQEYILETLPRKPGINEKSKTSGYFPFFKYNSKESFCYLEKNP